MPDFIGELVSVSRIGRSMGVHLILATQKPAASVSGEIWSNSRFHICLRVQTREDSTEMLHRPEAAFLKGMGRCYVQVGNDEVFEQVQSAYSGAPYEPNACSESERALAGRKPSSSRQRRGKTAKLDKNALERRRGIWQNRRVTRSNERGFVQ